MIGNKKILSIIPARGGSKGVKLKNLREIKGKSLTRRAIETSLACELVDKCIISTDHDQIVAEAVKCGIEVPFLRPESLSGDRIGDIDVLMHGLIESEKHFKTTFDIILMLQPTSPLRTAEDLKNCINKLLEMNLDSVWTVASTDLKYHPLKQLVFEDGLLQYFERSGSQIIARQQLSPVYHRNGCCYAFTRECLLDQKSIMGKRSSAIVIDRPMISIDTEEDIQRTEDFFNEFGLL